MPELAAIHPSSTISNSRIQTYLNILNCELSSKFIAVIKDQILPVNSDLVQVLCVRTAVLPEAAVKYPVISLATQLHNLGALCDSILSW